MPEPRQDWTGSLEEFEDGSPEQWRGSRSDRVVFRDLIIFQVKLFLDGVGDLVLAPLSLFAFLVDLLPGRPTGKLFYRVLRFGERWDRWLSLYRPSHEAGRTDQGLLGASQIDADTFLGKVEEMVQVKKPLKSRSPSPESSKARDEDA